MPARSRSYTINARICVRIIAETIARKELHQNLKDGNFKLSC